MLDEMKSFFLQFEECTIWKNELFAKIWLDLINLQIVACMQ